MSLTANSSPKSAGRRNESNNQQLPEIGEKKIFYVSNSQQLAEIGEKIIFDELDVDHVQKVGIKRFWAQDAEMSLTTNSSLKSARRKFFMNSTYIMSRKQESKVLGSGGKNESNSQQLCRIGESNIFDELDVHHVQKVGIKRFWAVQAELSLTATSSLQSARKKFFMNPTYIMSREQESTVFVLRRPQ